MRPAGAAFAEACRRCNKARVSSGRLSCINSASGFSRALNESHPGIVLFDALAWSEGKIEIELPQINFPSRVGPLHVDRPIGSIELARRSGKRTRNGLITHSAKLYRSHVGNCQRLSVVAAAPG